MFEDTAKKIIHVSSTGGNIQAYLALCINFITIADALYLSIHLMEKCKSYIDSKLFEYNKNNPVINYIKSFYRNYFFNLFHFLRLFLINYSGVSLSTLKIL